MKNQKIKIVSDWLLIIVVIFVLGLSQSLFTDDNQGIDSSVTSN